jgi:hypothetical protein
VRDRVIKATRIFLVDGDSAVVEHGENRCWASEEVQEIEIEVPKGTRCDICDETIPS